MKYKVVENKRSKMITIYVNGKEVYTSWNKSKTESIKRFNEAFKGRYNIKAE